MSIDGSDTDSSGTHAVSTHTNIKGDGSGEAQGREHLRLTTREPVLGADRHWTECCCLWLSCQKFILWVQNQSMFYKTMGYGLLQNATENQLRKPAKWATCETEGHHRGTLFICFLFLLGIRSEHVWWQGFYTVLISHSWAWGLNGGYEGPCACGENTPVCRANGICIFYL